MTPEQNIKKHINSPNLMKPNLVSKPLSWYNNERDLDTRPNDKPPSKRLLNVLGYIHNGDNFSPCEVEATESENVEEPDMKGIEEGIVSTKIDEMQPGRGRIRTSSQVFPTKDLTIRQ